MPEVITDIAQVTPAWLNNLFWEKGILHEGAVVDIHQVKSAKTNVSTCYRLEISYRDQVSRLSAPSCLLLKLSNPGFGWPAEVEFYNRVLPAMPATRAETEWPFLRCYDAVYSSEKKATHLLLEDLSATHFTTADMMPPTPRHCAQVIDAYACFHAFWWEHPRLGRDIGQFLTHKTIDDFLKDAQRRCGELTEFMAERLTGTQRDILAHVAAAWPPRRRERVVQGRGVTLVHRDPHPHNFLYSHEAPVKLIDWQSWRIDTGTDDLAYLMAFHWPFAARVRLEPELLKQYYERLIALGVSGYTWEDCQYDYRASIIRCLFFLIANWLPTRGSSYWGRIERGMNAFEHWECIELLPGDQRNS
jgi:hypothetical protein